MPREDSTKEGEFGFTLLPGSGRIEPIWAGYWTREVLERWRIKLQDLSLSHISAGGQGRLLIDQRNLTVFPKEAVDGLRAISATGRSRYERIALVLPTSAVAAMQARRISSVAGLFGADQIDDARAWICER